MKALYSITILLIITLVGCMNKTDDDQQHLPEQVKVADLTQYQTKLDIAKEEIAIYELGLQLVPQQYEWNEEESKISYTSLVIENEMLQHAIDSLIQHHSDSFKHTFSSKNSLAQSYFIHKRDIQAMTQILDSQDSTEVNGIRIYLAAESGSVTSSHVFIGPAFGDTIKQIYRNYYMGNQPDAYLYDLTIPCPNACGLKEFFPLKGVGLQ